MNRKLSTELRTLGGMVRLYCRGRHGSKEPCAECRELLSYAEARLKACPVKPKPSCRNCRVHCFSPGMRARIRAVMRYSGPRLALRHPLLTLRYYLGS